jgi:hypothetical protein
MGITVDEPPWYQWVMLGNETRVSRTAHDSDNTTIWRGGPHGAVDILWPRHYTGMVSPPLCRWCPSWPRLRQRRSPSMKKRHVSLYPAFERPALPVLPRRSRCLVRPNC